MSRRRKTKRKKSRFLLVILSIIIICALSFFVYFKFNPNDSKSYSAANTTNNNTKEKLSSDDTANETITSSANKVEVSANNSADNTTQNSGIASNATSNKTATNKTNYVVDVPTNTEASKGNEITVDKATELLKSNLMAKDSKIELSYDHTQNKNGVNYYVFQSFDSTGTSSSSADSHSDTLGWYYVNVTNGDLFAYDLNNDVLNPLK